MFPNKTGEVGSIKLVCIDNWISYGILQLLYDRCINFYYVNDSKIFNQKSAEVSRSHGTICASILAETMPDSAELTTISTTDGNRPIMIGNVCIALEWCMNESPDYLCMSIGSENWLETEELGKLTKQLADKGTRIFAACANNGHIVFPAAYPWVTGIRYEPGTACFYQEKNSPIGSNLIVGDFTTSVLEQLAAENSFFKCRTNSMATPYALGKMLSKDLALADLPMWEGRNSPKKVGEWPMPVVALCGPFQQMKELLALLQKESYQAALLTSRSETDWIRMVLHTTFKNLSEWVKPLEKAGILLIDAESSLDSIQECADCLIDFRKQNVSAAYREILEFFGTEEVKEKAESQADVLRL